MQIRFWLGILNTVFVPLVGTHFHFQAYVCTKTNLNIHYDYIFNRYILEIYSDFYVFPSGISTLFLNKIHRKVSKETLPMYHISIHFLGDTSNSSLQTLLGNPYRKIGNHFFRKNVLHQGLLLSLKPFDEHYYIYSRPVVSIE